jgi:heme o synthase
MSTTRTAVLPVMSRSAAYLSLTKPDVTFLVVMTTFAGFYLGSHHRLDVALLLNAVFGTTLVAAGTAALNHYFERDVDAKMRRTAGRPLPLGILQPTEAALFGAGLLLGGAAYLALLANGLAALLGLATAVSYLGLYTPLKKHTTLCTMIGAFPGAVPPLIGWAAATGHLSIGACILFGILFFWQFPHFFSIAWMYREDYARAGVKMLPVIDPAGTATFSQIIGTAVILVPVSLLAAVVGLAGIRYFFGAIILGMALVQVCLWAARSKSNTRAKWLMHATVAHLPILLGLMMFDKLAR